MRSAGGGLGEVRGGSGCASPAPPLRPELPNPPPAPSRATAAVCPGAACGLGAGEGVWARAGNWVSRRAAGRLSPAMARQVTITFKDLAVRFSEEEWRLLEERQREFYREVMRENYETLVSVGTAELLPLSAFLSPMEPGRAIGGGERADKGQEPLARGGPQGGKPQHSLHLTALVQLVKEIPEFLFREVKGTVDSPESRGASLDGDGASSEAAAVAVDNCPLQSQLSCLPDSPSDWQSLATTPSGSSSSSGLLGDRGQGSPLPIRTSPGSSPLQGLISSQKEIPVPRPQHPEVAPKPLPPPPSLVSSKLTKVELGPASLPWPVKTETASGDCPLQGLLNCLKEIPEARGRHPNPSRARDPQPQEEPGAWKRTSGGPGHHQTPPPHPGPGSGSVLAVVKMEDSWTQSPPVPTSCQLTMQIPSLSTSRDTRGVRAPYWGPVAQAGRASSSPLEALEACLKGIPPSVSSLPQPLAASWSQSPQPGDPGSRKPELRPHGSHSEEVTKEPLLHLAPRGCVREGPARPSGPRGTPTGFSSASSTDGDLDFGSPVGNQGQWPRKGSPLGSSPLQGLENCLKEIPVPRPQPAWPCSSAADRGPRRMELRNWAADKEGLRGEACEPAHPGQGGGEVPARSLHLASPQAFSSSCIPACHQRGLKDHRTARPGPERWLQDGAPTRPSPLHCLETSLREILPVRPLRFACLAGPGPSPSPSSSSSLSSSDGEDLRLEPEVWQQPLQERDRLPSCRHPVPLSPSPGRAPAGSSGSSPGEAPGRTEPQSCSNVSAGGRAEEVTEGRSQLPEREDSNCQPGAPISAREGRVGRAAESPCPAPRLEKRPRPEAGEEPRGLEPEHRRPSITARTQGRLLPRGQPKPDSESPQPELPPLAAVSPALPAACHCGKPLQQELHNLGAALEEKLDRLATALAGLAQEVANMRTQVDRLGRRPRGPGSKGQAPWPWTLPQGPRWGHGLGRRHMPYWRQKGPTRPKPKILRVQTEGCRAGDSPGLPRGRVRLAPQLPSDASPAEPSGPNHSPPQQPVSSAPSCYAALTGHPPLRHTGGHQVPPPPLVPVALPPQVASPATSADAEPTRISSQPKELNGLLGGVQRALQEELWGGEHRDPRWGAH
ncbi:protein KRBA1 isoform X4 [Oryctolagus cuniculus]|uniref:protein KRBA1 isoform X4 n=1 Tax=Oryctolagus cuniculus TaxID=9986 RepID=UPI003879ADC1